MGIGPLIFGPFIYAFPIIIIVAIIYIVLAKLEERLK
jgi:hypothetical protein